MLPSLDSLIALLRLRSQEEPESRGYTFLVDGEEEEAHLSYGELDRQARAIGALLQAQGARGERALLLFPPGNEYLAAFFGCLYAGAVAVPAYPPDPSRLNRSLPRLEAMVRDAGARFVLTTGMIHSMAEMLFEQAPELGALKWLATDAPEAGLEDQWKEPEVRADTLAFLQYTSGSTGSPKGVMLTHGNLLANSALIHSAFGHSRESRGVIWLPPYHDMGLIGGLLQPLYGAFPVVLLSPIAFLQRPFRWLKAVSRYGATTSGGPNFAYDLCVRKSSPEERETLDLRRWKVAFNGAEPIRPETLERFHQTFAPCGFRKEAFYSCYGLAESTLIVTGHTLGTAPVTDGANLVSSGRALSGNTVRLVDPQTRRECAPGQEGEIWVSGPSTGQGYWQRPEETERVFRATLEGSSEGPFLRTGDLGVLRDGELFVTGRIKDLIILRGRNIYPQDIEASVIKSHPAMRPGCTAAFAIDAEGQEQLVVVQEVDSRQAGTDLEALVGGVRQVVAEEHDVQVHTVVLIKSGSIPKTSSGKIQRQATKAAFLEKELEVLSESALPAAPVIPEAPPPALSVARLQATSEQQRQILLEEHLIGAVAAKLRVAPASIDPEQPIIRLGLDSLAVVELKSDVDGWLDADFPLARLLDTISLRALAGELLGWMGSRPPALVPAGKQEGAQPVSEGQKALWLMHQLAPRSAAYNLAFAVRLRSGVDVPTLREALRLLVERHPSLRTTFRSKGEQLLQQVHPAGAVELTLVDATAEDASALKRRLGEDAARPFDLERGPLLRATLYARPQAEQVLLLAAHHIAIDLWSMAVLAEELHRLYPALLAGKGTEVLPPATSIQYTDFARWQHQYLSGANGDRLWRYWQQRLGEELPALDLPTDWPRPPLQTFRGAAVEFRLDRTTTRRLRSLSRESGATLFATLLAAYQVLLCRHTGQQHIVVGSPTAGRTHPGLEGLVGYFVNPVVLTGDVSGAPSFRDFLAQVRKTILDALEHQALPFPLLADRLRYARDTSRSPIFQTMFAWEQPHRSPEITPLVLGLEGVPVKWAGLEAESLRVEMNTSPFELSLQMAEVDGELAGSLRYASDLFDASSMARLVARFQRLIEAILANPGQRVSELALLPETERQHLLALGGGRSNAAADGCVHRRFESHAARAPEALAVSGAGHELTYAELDRRSNQLAHLLRRMGVGPEVPVGILLRRSPEMIAAWLATLKAGGIAVPLDPASPRERLAWVIDDARPPVIVTDEQLRSRLPPSAQVITLNEGWDSLAGQPATAPEAPVSPSQLAYAIYTSGSTGQPKGVQVSHESLANMIAWHQREYAVTPADRVSHVASPIFDASIMEIWSALATGASLHLPDEDDRTSPERIISWLARERITIAYLPTPMVETVLGLGWPDQLALRELITGGDELHGRPRPNQRFRLTNIYGPTEATIGTTCATVLPGGTEGVPPPIGRPLDAFQLYVLDAQLRLQPAGVPGELFIGGKGLARGYLNRPELTAERFIPDPFSTEPGARLYRTGDLVRYLLDGNLQFLGRIDHQVKLRGVRIELGEIEAVLRHHPSVRQCVAVVRGETSLDKVLVAYVVLHSGQSAEPDALREYLRQRLPEAMIPSAFVFLPELPLTPNGKVDRRALPAPAVTRANLREAFVAPRTPTEEAMARLWTELLRVESIGIHDNWFELGGNSLVATQLLSRLRQSFGVELPLRRVFEAPTIAGLTTSIEAERGASSPLAPALRRAERPAHLPLSFAQERLWFLEQLEPGTGRYNLPAAVSLRGELDTCALEWSLSEIVRRHEALRTTFPLHDGHPVQAITAPSAVELPFLDLRSMPALEREAEVRALITREAQAPFSLATGPLLRARLLRLGAQEHILLLTLHHIIADGWSVGVLVRELTALYAARTSATAPSLPEPPIQYADFTLWQREWLQGEALQTQLSFWKERLAGAPAALELATDRPRPAVQGFAGGRHAVRIPAELARAVVELGRREGCTPFMTLLAAFQVLLSRYSHQEDLVIGCPLANRNRMETEGLIGFFVNVLPFRADLSGNPRVRELLSRVREMTTAAHAHQDVPFEKLVEALELERDLSRTPLFQVAFSLQEAPLPPRALPGLETRLLEPEAQTAKFDLTLVLEGGEEGLSAAFEYRSDLFEASTIQRMAGHFLTLLTGLATQPDARLSELPLLSRAERQQLLADWNQTAVATPAECVHTLFEEWAARSPGALAVEAEGQRLTYSELNRRANRLAHRLRALGVGPDVPVALCIERSPALVEAALGVLKAGGAYLPLDPTAPPERTLFALEDARAPVLLASRATAPTAPASCRVLLAEESWQAGQEPESNPGLNVGPRNLAYVIYTSGSTGQPKGVEIEHAGLSNLVTWHQRAYRVEPSDRMTQVAGPAFDASVWETWPCLASGASLHIVGDALRADPAKLVTWMAAQRITQSFLPTPLAEQVLPLSWPEGTTLRVLLTGGDQLHRGAPAGVPFRLINHYGPTESSVVATCSEVRPGVDSAPPIGRPISNTQVFILDARMQPVPVGVPGELFIGGKGLARGYLNRPELTAERFVAHPFDATPGARLYRTGDRVRYLPDGQIEFLGRSDDQVKVRGFRIELGELESLAVTLPGVRQAAACVREDRPGLKRLVLYAAVEAGRDCEQELRALLRKHLPEYMVPSAIVLLEALPLTPNGKVDRRALPEPQSTGSGEVAPPRTPAERTLVEIWASVLGTESIGIHDDFFELGGNSLLATQLISRVRETFKVEIPLRSAFEARTVATLAEAIERQAEFQEEPTMTARKSEPEAMVQVDQLSEAELDSLLAELESEEAKP
ncbi:non-ribosomal peptide synthetase [Hyalangium versicolor]|uniref:non-ribosomal peptide synthetase n=1 Tax=Hyalangium versicolor TaxID=2861190 RepID=UPI001CCF346D|nr:non-ribosomal peptide synthetase [Hyalangium versicolor]